MAKHLTAAVAVLVEAVHSGRAVGRNSNNPIQKEAVLSNR